MTNETSPAIAPDPATNASPTRWTAGRKLLIAILVIGVLDAIVMVFFAPPGFPDPQKGINQNLEVIPPLVVWEPQPTPPPTGSLVVEFSVSITNSIVTSWVVMVVMIVAFVGVARSLHRLPRRMQNATTRASSAAMTETIT